MYAEWLWTNIYILQTPRHQVFFKYLFRSFYELQLLKFSEDFMVYQSQNYIVNVTLVSKVTPHYGIWYKLLSNKRITSACLTPIIEGNSMFYAFIHTPYNIYYYIQKYFMCHDWIREFRKKRKQNFKKVAGVDLFSW